jgi:hypothetical protein
LLGFWDFIGKERKDTAARDAQGTGGVRTFIALDANTRLIPSTRRVRVREAHITNAGITC